MTCDCNLCSLSRRVAFVLDAGERPELRDMVEELFGLYESMMLDENWANAVIDGSWPNADEIIKHAREVRKVA